MPVESSGGAGTSPELREAHAEEVARGERFAFGHNWAKYVRLIDAERIAEAERSLTQMLGAPSLAGLRFLDIGCGSGLFSLAARRLGAQVHSLDYDPTSVACAQELKRRFAPGDAAWTIEQGSVLDRAYVESLGRFDVVYSWGVLHHTGEMWQACENATIPVAPGGQLFVSIYNDQGAWSERWKKIKRVYCSGPVGRAAVCAVFVPATVVRNFAADIVWRRNPLKRYVEYKRSRGMSLFRDMIDWLGGYPFEVAKPEAVFEFFTARGFRMRKLKTAGGSVGCNEFVFEYLPSEAATEGARHRAALEGWTRAPARGAPRTGARATTTNHATG
jgi:2-polyprenyl-3-methyl-5-hydroxy-6-metoxy-1,4-benzoquinol methylase